MLTGVGGVEALWPNDALRRYVIGTFLLRIGHYNVHTRVNPGVHVIMANAEQESPYDVASESIVRPQRFYTANARQH